MHDMFVRVPDKALSLAKLLPCRLWHAYALDFLEMHLNQPWAVACSGGADSVALLLLCWAYWPQQRNKLIVYHYNHALRGKDSDQDAHFVMRLAQALNLAFKQERSEHNNESLFSEATLRQARYEFLEASMHTLGIRVLLLGHQADDAAETLFMRLARGSGLGGLISPRPVTPIKNFWRVRPLIGINKMTLQTSLQTVGMKWREDSSNTQSQYLRNRVRQALPTVMETIFGPQWLNGFCASRELLQEDANALDFWANQVMTHHRKAQPLDWRPIMHAPKAVQRRVLYHWLEDTNLKLEKTTFEAILTSLHTNQPGSWNVAMHHQLVFTQNQVFLKQNLDKATFWFNTQTAVEVLYPFSDLRLSNTAILKAEVLHAHDWKELTAPNPFVAYIALAADITELKVRFWQPGDSYQPLGLNITKKLQDMFIDAKVPKHIRHQLPCILHPDGEILWIPGLRRSEKTRYREGFRPWKLTYCPHT